MRHTWKPGLKPGETETILCCWLRGSFSNHEIVWKGGCGDSDEIFDACLNVAGDPDTKPAQDDIFASKMTYSVYEPKLVIPSYRTDVQPKQSTKIRRIVK